MLSSNIKHDIKVPDTELWDVPFFQYTNLGCHNAQIGAETRGCEVELFLLIFLQTQRVKISMLLSSELRKTDEASPGFQSS